MQYQQGHHDIYVSVRPDKKPSKTDFDISSKEDKNGAYHHLGKYWVIPFKNIQELNPACGDLGFAEHDNCILNILVDCPDYQGCKSKIEISYDNSKPKKIWPGQNKHASIIDQKPLFYYITVKKSEITDFYGVLSPLSGDLDLYVTFDRVSQSSRSTDLKTPSQAHNYMSSVER